MTTRLLAAAAAFSLAASVQADIFSFNAILNGPSEAPPNASPGTGIALVDWDTATGSMRVQATFSGLVAATTACHIHGATTLPLTGTAGVATQTPSFTGFPLGVTAGAMDQTFDMSLASSYNPSYITNNGGTPASAGAALLSAMQTGRTYFNIHSTAFPGGEIRGFLVPGPGSVALLGLGGVFAARRRR